MLINGESWMSQLMSVIVKNSPKWNQEINGKSKIVIVFQRIPVIHLPLKLFYTKNSWSNYSHLSRAILVFTMQENSGLAT